VKICSEELLQSFFPLAETGVNFAPGSCRTELLFFTGLLKVAMDPAMLVPAPLFIVPPG
jgi:hypothetical protein